MSFTQNKPKWRSLVIIHSSMFGENQIQHISAKGWARWWKTDDLGLEHCSQWVEQKKKEKKSPDTFRKHAYRVAMFLDE